LAHVGGRNTLMYIVINNIQNEGDTEERVYGVPEGGGEGESMIKLRKSHWD